MTTTPQVQEPNLQAGADGHQDDANLRFNAGLHGNQDPGVHDNQMQPQVAIDDGVKEEQMEVPARNNIQVGYQATDNNTCCVPGYW